MTSVLIACLMAAAPMQQDDGRERPNRRGNQEIERLKKQAQDLEAKAQELTRQLEDLEGDKRAEAQRALDEIRVALKEIKDQILRLDPRDPAPVAPPVAPRDPRERELLDRIAVLQKRIQSKEFKDERELEKLLAEQRQLENELAEIRAHAREMKGMHQPGLPPMNEEQRRRMLDEVAAWLKENEPHLAEQLNILGREKRWDEQERLLRDVYGKMTAMQDLKRRDPKEFERVQKMNRLDADSRRLGEDLRRAKDPETRAELKAKLKETLVELFDMRETARWRELEALEAQVKELRRTLESRKENRDKIIEKRAKELGGEKDDTDW
jgi:polyhydroxyalkanoate synthesis regulator phasin